jgi:maltose alpha-D-glucosyltransferase/alpha-amylase
VNVVARHAPDRLSEWLARDFQSRVPPWLPSQRWFGGKARRISAVIAEDVVWLDSGDSPAALVITRIDYTDGSAGPDRYALVMGIASGGTAPADAVADSHGGATVVECGAAPATVQALLRALVDGTALVGSAGGAIVADDQAATLAEILRAAAPPMVRPLSNEQSNTSVRVGGAHVFKLIRRLQAGVHPQLEIGRFLRRAAFRAAPPLEGSLTYRAADGGRYALGVVEGWVDNHGDGWNHVVARLESAARAGQAAEVLADDFCRLGTTTAEFHLAMASDRRDADFAPEPVTPEHRVAWRNQALEQTQRAVTLLERVVPRWPEPLRSRGNDLIAARVHVERRVAKLDAQARDNDFCLIRIHGDFHLGQTLKTADGYTLIDFEGEPVKPIAERRIRQCALKDVAGMLRSIEYAAAYVRARLPAAPAESLATVPLRRAFFDSYVAESRRRGALYLPATWVAISGLSALFELEKALYELDYEVNNRPDWIHIPLEAVTGLVGMDR